MFGRLGMWELLLILVIALIIFGPKKLPEMGKALGDGIREFRGATKKLAEDNLDGDTEKDQGASHEEKQE